MKINIYADKYDMNRFQEALSSLAVASRKTIAEVLSSQIRLLASDMAYVTSPKGIRNDKQTNVIEWYIRAIYPSVGVVVNLLKQKNEGIGIGFAVAIAKRNIAKAQAIVSKHLPEMNITVGAFDGGALHKANRKRASITERRCVVGYTRVEAYIKTKKKKSGYAKGGFATAARQLGGVRGIPGWATRQKTPGRGQLIVNGDKATVIIENHAKNIKDALTRPDEAQAINHRRRQVDKVAHEIMGRNIRKAKSKMR